MKITLAPNEFLDDYVLGCEFAKNAEISGNSVFVLERRDLH